MMRRRLARPSLGALAVCLTAAVLGGRCSSQAPSPQLAGTGGAGTGGQFSPEMGGRGMGGEPGVGGAGAGGSGAGGTGAGGSIADGSVADGSVADGSMADGSVADGRGAGGSVGTVDAGSRACGPSLFCPIGTSYCYSTVNVGGTGGAGSPPRMPAYSCAAFDKSSCAAQPTCECLCQSICPQGFNQCFCSGSPPTQLDCMRGQ